MEIHNGSETRGIAIYKVGRRQEGRKRGLKVNLQTQSPSKLPSRYIRYKSCEYWGARSNFDELDEIVRPDPPSESLHAANAPIYALVLRTFNCYEDWFLLQFPTITLE
jgi:hypothetical protein